MLANIFYEQLPPDFFKLIVLAFNFTQNDFIIFPLSFNMLLFYPLFRYVLFTFYTANQIPR